jgi:hypothetical protein
LGGSYGVGFGFAGTFCLGRAIFREFSVFRGCKMRLYVLDPKHHFDQPTPFETIRVNSRTFAVPKPIKTVLIRVQYVRKVFSRTMIYVWVLETYHLGCRVL